MGRLFDYPGPLWRVRATAALGVAALFVLVWAPVIAIAVFGGASRAYQTKLLRIWLHYVSRLAGIRYVVEGAGNHDPSKPSLVVCNHQSLFDIPAAFAALGGDLRMMAKAELFKIPGFGPSLRRTEFIPIERESRNSSRQAAEALRARILSGLHVWVAPEGTRSETGALSPFKKGSFAIAIQAGIPIQPLVITNSRLACPKGSLLPRPGTVIYIKVLPRMSAEGYAIEQRGLLADQVHQAMQAALLTRPEAGAGTATSVLRPPQA